MLIFFLQKETSRSDWNDANSSHFRKSLEQLKFSPSYLRIVLEVEIHLAHIDHKTTLALQYLFAWHNSKGSRIRPSLGPHNGRPGNDVS